MVGTLVSVRKKLQQLEGGRGGGCGYCGGGDDDGDWDEPYEIYFDDEVPDDFEDVCPECGEEWVIYFDDDPRAPWNRGTA